MTRMICDNDRRGMLNMWPGCNDAGDDDADTEDVTRMPQEPVEIRQRNDDGTMMMVPS